MDFLNDKNSVIQYQVFKTKWGYFGIGAKNGKIIVTVMPNKSKERVKVLLLKQLPSAVHKSGLCPNARTQIIRYFSGKSYDMNSVKVDLNHLKAFEKSVLTACTKVNHGQTASYNDLAKMIKKPRSSRAVGNALAKNPIPLIIPCHRVICSDGTIGNYSGSGGAKTKKMLIEHEKNYPLKKRRP